MLDPVMLPAPEAPALLTRELVRTTYDQIGGSAHLLGWDRLAFRRTLIARCCLLWGSCRCFKGSCTVSFLCGVAIGIACSCWRLCLPSGWGAFSL